MMQDSLFDLPPVEDECAGSAGDAVQDDDDALPPDAPIAPEWLAMQKMAHDLVELINLTNAPRLGKVDRFLADKAALLANYIDRIIKPLEPK